MRFGVHLPQFGRAAGPESIAAAARRAEELGIDDVWVSDHIAFPSSTPMPAFIYEPVIALTWAAAATRTVGLGTTVLVLPYRHPLHLAKELASLDVLSGGRLIVGGAAGWLEGEFEALGIPFRERGARTDEAIGVLRACWEQDPVSFEGRFTRLKDMRVLPQPGRRIPIWVGGHSDAAIRRAATKGDAWHATFLAPDAAAPLVRKVRELRPEPDFTVSMRQNLDPLAQSPEEVRRAIEGYRDAGFQHVLASPSQRDADGWVRAVEALAGVFGEFR